jgi:hypothetical protein
MNRETSRTSRRMAPERRERRMRSSGRREGVVRVGHNKLGRPRVRPIGRAAVDAEDLPERYPNLRAHRELEHAQHVRRAMSMGLTRKQAERHSRDDERTGRLQERVKRRGAKARTGTSH